MLITINWNWTGRSAPASKVLNLISVGGKRGRGSPHLRRKNQVTNDFGALGTTNSIQQVIDRAGCRKLLDTAKDDSRLLIILMAMGLGALYMLHMLAEDYNKIRQPIAAARAATQALMTASATLARGKRGLPTSDNQTNLDLTTSTNNLNSSNNVKLNIDWKRILSRDPFHCLLSLICQLVSGAEQDSKDATQILKFLESSLSDVPTKISRAFSCGLVFRGATERCYNEYPFCIYSAKTMLRILKWFLSSSTDPE
ncbi:uncharacterized protein LOC119688284 [Teleopsis dalmanni]|uniref:uncharacterized protein LOC119688284 n=1 Tax=Teleopsis dalmanni TaxID=139649 RepID=UPI0018CDB67C|nr:uncharacterized protein LOC119688284 [Teleopsis dalmanni]